MAILNIDYYDMDNTNTNDRNMDDSIVDNILLFRKKSISILKLECE